MAETEIIEEYNPWTRAITEMEGSLALLTFYWGMLAILLFYGRVDPIMFERLILTGTVVVPLVKKIAKV